MQFHAATCPQCSGPLQLPDNKDVVKCMYCGADIVIREAIGKSDTNVANLLELAMSAESSQNYSEAYGYFSRVLEASPKNVEAWRGKGSSAGWQSNLVRNRFPEVIQCYREAISNCTDEAQSEEIKQECALHAYLIAKAYFDTSLQHTIQFIGLQSANDEHRDRVREVIGLCEFALELNPTLPDIPAFMIDIANRQLKYGGLTTDEKSYFQSIIRKYSHDSDSPASAGKVDKSSAGGGAISLIVIAIICLLIFKACSR